MPLRAALVGFGLATLTQVLQAQLIVENPGQRWTAGEAVEVVLRDAEIRHGIRIQQLLFDGEAIAFEEIGTEPGKGEMRLRAHLPLTMRSDIRHKMSVVFSDATVAVPEILGLPVDEARQRLGERGLRLDTGEWRGGPSGLVAHTVARQNPAAGARARHGSRIAAVVASTVEVPDVRGLPVEEARRELAARSLELVLAAPPGGAVQWIIEEITPPAGTRVATGTGVSATATGEAPDLIGLRIEAARSLILASGLLPGAVLREPAEGPFETVLTQHPAAGQRVSLGAGITVAIESRPDPPLSWPWQWLAAAGASSLLLRQRVQGRRTLRRSVRIVAHQDLDRLRERAAPAGEGHRPLDVRLIGRPDRGSQTIEYDGPLTAQEAPP